MSLPELDEMLTIFDRANLNRDDIPILLDTAKRSKLSTTLHPLREELSYEFMVLAAELLAGPTVLNLNYPTAALRIEGHRTYIEKNLGAGHSLYSEIREAVGRERKNNFKISTESKEKKGYILFTGREYDPAVGKMAGRLAAFGTCNQVIVNNFIMDVEHLRKNILTNKPDRNEIILYLKDLIHKGKPS